MSCPCDRSGSPGGARSIGWGGPAGSRRLLLLGGIRLSDAIPVVNEKSGLREFRSESHEKVRASAALAREWVRSQPQPSSEQPATVPDLAGSARRRIPSPDFVLKDLEGTAWRLSDQRGRVVLINFWTTWCTACVGELPALIELRRRHGADLVILGVSQDSLAGGHGHAGGHGAGGQHDADGPRDHGDEATPPLKEIRRNVEMTVRRRGINYPVLIDARNEVGSRYNGGELPTTVIVDKEGFVHRRLVGPRPIEVFEAMIQEASRRDLLPGPAGNP
ncbi:MAG: TlpA family protein disulfide reductase [Verrucomicrobiae bacterium]|nr:TlpA family protein disulfide reductase [Verrucomicrobiae bacterium]